MSSTNYLVRRMSRKNSDFDGIDFFTGTDSNSNNGITEEECRKLQAHLSDSFALPASCKLIFERALQSDSKRNESSKGNHGTLRRRQSYVAMHDYPPTAC